MAEYKLIKEIGRGGMGVVFSALQLSLGREVAIKFLHDDSAESEETSARFHREVASLIALSHPNIIKVVDSGEMGGRLFFAVEYLIESRSLQEILRRERAQQQVVVSGARRARAGRGAIEDGARAA